MAAVDGGGVLFLPWTVIISNNVQLLIQTLHPCLSCKWLYFSYKMCSSNKVDEETRKKEKQRKFEAVLSASFIITSLGLRGRRVDMIVVFFHRYPPAVVLVVHVVLPLTTWWILLSTTINPFYRAPLTCEIHLQPHVWIQNTHTLAHRCRHTHKHFFFPLHSILRHKHTLLDIRRNFFVCKKHSGVPSASTCREWHMTSTKVIPEPSSASLLRDHSD